MLALWIVQNKLASLLMAATIALLAATGVQTLRLKSAQSTIAEQSLQLKTRNALIESWVTVTRLANENREAAQVKVSNLAIENKKLKERLNVAIIPKDCAGAISWGSQEAIRAAERWNR